MRATSILAEDDLRREMLKVNRPQTNDKLNKLIDHFAIQNQYEHLSNMGTEGEDT